MSFCDDELFDLKYLILPFNNSGNIFEYTTVWGKIKDSSLRSE